MHAPTLSTYAFEPLSKRHNQVHHSFDKSFSTRMTRALSWLERAEQETDDLDAGFVFYWISFNATYSMSIEEVEGFTEMDKITQFLDLIIQCDEKNEIYDIIWSRFTREIRGILNNPFIFKDYWICVAKGSGDEWKDRFEASKKVVNYALSKKNTLSILQTLFSRLYVLRNQLMHGSATWNGATNRRQVTDGYHLIRALQPVFLSLMLENPSKQWGDVNFPRINKT